jgi:DNA-binding IclR family transcriptional regulator
MPHVFLTNHQVAFLALIPKAGGMSAEALAQATTFPLRIVREQLQGLVAGELLVHDEATGEFRHPEKSDA